MRRTLSSAQTFLMKLVLPSMWIAGFTVATVLLFTTGSVTDTDGVPPSPQMKWFFLAATTVGGFCWYWWCMRLKRVEIDDQWLYVSNYVREIQVALGDIEEISENRWVNIRPITVTFRRETEFGPRIVFMPRALWWGFWRPHPVVRELEDAARRARGIPPARPAA
jgi:hypothetical protein